MEANMPLSKIFAGNRNRIESNPLKIGDIVEFPINLKDSNKTFNSAGEVVPVRGKVIAIRNEHNVDVLLPKYIIAAYSWFGNYYKKCGPKDVCRLGQYEELFETPMRNTATKAQVSDYLLDIENKDSESCQYEAMENKAVINGFYDTDVITATVTKTEDLHLDGNAVKTEVVLGATDTNETKGPERGKRKKPEVVSPGAPAVTKRTRSATKKSLTAKDKKASTTRLERNAAAIKTGTRFFKPSVSSGKETMTESGSGLDSDSDSEKSVRSGNLYAF